MDSLHPFAVLVSFPDGHLYFVCCGTYTMQVLQVYSNRKNGLVGGFNPFEKY